MSSSRKRPLEVISSSLGGDVTGISEVPVAPKRARKARPKDPKGKSKEEVPWPSYFVEVSLGGNP
jgi:hypothetical protein